MTTREDILSRIRQAREALAAKERVPKPDFMTDVYINSPEIHIEVIFAENFKKNGGIFFYSEDIEKALFSLKGFLSECEISSVVAQDEYLQALIKVAHIHYTEEVTQECTMIAACEFLIARTGAVLISPPKAQTLPDFSKIKRLILWAFSSQLVYDTQSALLITQEKTKNQLPTNLTIIQERLPSLYLLNSNLASNFHSQQELILFLIDDLSEEFSTPS